MHISQHELEQIVDKASSISDRLNNYWSIVSSIPSNEFTSTLDNESDHFINLWCKTIARGDKNIFKKRLSWDELNIDLIQKILQVENYFKTNRSLPTWKEILYEVLEDAELSLDCLERQDTRDCSVFISKEPLPFEEILIPFLRVGRRRLLKRAGVRYNLLSENCHITLERHLLSRLVNLCSQALQLEFSIHKAIEQPELVDFIERVGKNKSKRQYTAFFKEILGKRLLTFFQKYSVLARLASTVTECWIDAAEEFLERLESDWIEIHATFGNTSCSKQVVAVKPALSDPHRNGRYVLAITFDSGFQIVYKPKDLGLDESYCNLLNWLNTHDELPELKSLKIINHNNYGWVSYVAQLPCQNRQEAQHYYQRAGMLICLLYILKATDCHFENLVACGEFPVLIDMENLIYHDLRKINIKPDQRSGQDLAAEQLLNSVLRTGLLPQWEFGFMNKGYEVSGLGGVVEQNTFSKIQVWKDINTDDMTLSYEFSKAKLKSNVVFIDGISLHPIDFLDDIIDGFKLMYEFILQKKEFLLSENSPLRLFSVKKVRFIFRPTRVYWTILNQSLSPRFLQDGRSRSILLETLSKGLLTSEKKPISWSITKAEYEALEKMDIPYFYSYSNSSSLFISDNEKIEQYFQEPSYSSVISGLKNLSYADLEQQIGLVKGALYSQINLNLVNSLQSEMSQIQIDPNILSSQILEQEAFRIAEELSRRAICGTDGSKAWIGLEYSPELQSFKLRPIGFSLYDGCCGISLFLSALYKVSQNKEYRDFSLSALKTLRKSLSNQDFGRFAEETGLGGAVGLGAIVYSLVCCSQLLGDDVLLQDAIQVASFITPEMIYSDKYLDLLSGVAGAILGLLRLYRCTDETKFLDKAILCGEHLVNSIVLSPSGYKAWVTTGGKFLTGFSHGAAGISYALLKLYEATENPIFLKEAIQGINHESVFFSKEYGNWVDLRSEQRYSASPYQKRSWCHGSPGIILGSIPILQKDGGRGQLFAIRHRE